MKSKKNCKLDEIREEKFMEFVTYSLSQRKFLTFWGIVFKNS